MQAHLHILMFYLLSECLKVLNYLCILQVNEQ